MAKKMFNGPLVEETQTVVVEPEKPKPTLQKAAVILQNCLAQLDKHPDAKLVSVQRFDVKDRDRAFFDVMLSEQEELVISVILKVK